MVSGFFIYKSIIYNALNLLFLWKVSIAVENKNNKKLNPIELESLRSELIEKTLNTSSNNLRLYLYQNYFEKILFLCNPNIEEAFLKEFFDDYISCICKFEVWGVEPDITKELQEQFKKVSALKIAFENTNLLNSEIDRIEKQLEKLNLILDGKDVEDDETHKAFFPLIDKDAPVEHPYGKGFYGIIESITVRINKAVTSDKFIIVPSEKEIEKKILEQCQKSWLLALGLSKKYVKKPFKHHEVIISFDKKQGFYEGNSLGIALTLSFLDQILKFYNPAFIINVKEQSAFTGGVTEAGEVLCTSEDIIKRKVAAVFFSEINSFVFPKCEETYAYFALTQLKNSYPGRKLKLIPVEEINDVLNRRDVIKIKKQKLIVRTGKFIKKNWISAAVTVLLAILFGYLFVVDFDDNPAMVFYNSNQIFVTNKNSKKLFSFPFTLQWGKIEEINKYLRILDINNDGKNEILFVESPESANSNNLKMSSLSCYDKHKKLLWNYNFDEIVSSNREIMIPEYGIDLVDTVNENGKMVLVAYACNAVSFASAVFKIDLLKGKKIGDAFWCSGHINDAILTDINMDKKKEFIGWASDNGFEQPVIWAMNLDTLQGARPTTQDYQIHDKQEAKLLFYIRTPNTDYDRFANHRQGIPAFIGLFYEEQNNTLCFQTIYNLAQLKSALIYRLNVKSLELNIFIDDNYRISRDTLVAKGKLKPPFTDTKEYITNLKNQILYWQPTSAINKNGKWVKREELE